MTVNFNLGFVADAAGTVDAITALYTPTYTVLLDKMLVWFRATGANTSTTPTFSPNGLTARTIVKQGGQPLVAGDIPRAGAIMEMVYDATNTRWELVNPAVATSNPGYLVYTALLTQTSNNAPVATVLENNIGTITWGYTSTGAYTITGTGLFTVGKTMIIFGAAYYAIPDPAILIMVTNRSVNGFAINTLDAINGFIPVDDSFSQTAVEIRVYP